MLKKRLTKIAALCIASTLLLAGCSGGSTKSSPNPDSEKDSAAAAPIVLKFSDVNAEQSPAGIFCRGSGWRRPLVQNWSTCTPTPPGI